MTNLHCFSLNKFFSKYEFDISDLVQMHAIVKKKNNNIVSLIHNIF